MESNRYLVYVNGVLLTRYDVEFREEKEVEIERLCYGITKYSCISMINSNQAIICGGL